MPYTPWSVVLNETPSTAKWNILGANDASFADGTGIANLAIKKAHLDFNSGVWWEEIGRTTLSTAADAITVSSLPARRYLMILYVLNATGGTITAAAMFNNDSGNNYAARLGANNTGDATSVNRSNLIWDANVASAQTHNGYAYVILNEAAQEKLVTGYTIRNSAGAGNVPDRIAHAGKWANTSSAISRVDLVNVGTGDYAIGSRVIVLGHD